MTLTPTVPAYRTFDLEVATVQRLSPGFVRITFTGPELSAFDDGGALGTRDTRVKLVIPDSSATRPATAIDVTDPDWYRRWLALDPRERGHLRTYTARALRTGGAATELDIDFILHLDERGEGGPATVWAARALPGDRLTVLGPNGEHPQPGGFEWRPPAPAGDRSQQLLLVGDETALPAIASILERLPEQYAGDAVIELPCMEDAQPLRRPAGVRVTYLARNDRPRGDLTLQTLASLLGTDGPDGPGTPDGPGAPDLADPTDPELIWEASESGSRPRDLYAWVAGEASVVREVRRALVGPYGLDRRQVAFMGYWREGRSEG